MSGLRHTEEEIFFEPSDFISGEYKSPVFADVTALIYPEGENIRAEIVSIISKGKELLADVLPEKIHTLRTRMITYYLNFIRTGSEGEGPSEQTA